MRVLIISDIHANMTAFDAVLQDANDEWDYVWCLGDVVGYGPDPNECVEQLRKLPHLCLAGNHDWAALGRIDVSDFRREARLAAQWTQEMLKPDNMAYLEALPVTFVIGDYTLVHASPREPVIEYIFTPEIAALNFPHFETPYCLCGHTHVPVLYGEADDSSQIPSEEYPQYQHPHHMNGHRTIINPGSIGQPRDRNPDAAYAILDLDTQEFEHRRVAYDIPSVQKRIRDAGLPERLADRLSEGW